MWRSRGFIPAGVFIVLVLWSMGLGRVGATAAHASSVRLQVESDQAWFGDTVSWTVSVVNGGLLSVAAVHVDICAPADWVWSRSDVPTDSIGDEDSRCRRHLLGSVPGRSTKAFSVTFSLAFPQSFTVGQTQSDFEARLSGMPSGTTRRLLLDAVTLRDTALVPSWFDRSLEIVGRAYMDVRGDGRDGPGKPAAAGSVIVADGHPVGTADRSGYFHVVAPRGSKLLWAVDHTGESMPRPVGLFHVPPIAPLRVDLAVVVPEVGDPSTSGSVPADAAPGEGPERPRAVFSVAGGLQSGVRGSEGKADLGVTIAGPRTRVRADLGVGASALPQDIPWLSGASAPMVHRWAPFVRSAAVEAAGGDGGEMRWEADVYSGPLTGRRSGSLRPSQPVQDLIRLGTEGGLYWPGIPANKVPSEAGSTGLTGPAAGSALTGRGQIGYARGDLWSCRLYDAQARWTAPAVTVDARAAWADHETMSPSGTRHDRPMEGTVMLTTSVPTAGQTLWPVYVEIERGRSRRIAPSCGLSPARGDLGRLIVAPPVTVQRGFGRVVEAVQLTAGHWPDGAGGLFDDETANPAAGTPDDAYELAVRFRPVIRASAPARTWTAGAAIQWIPADRGVPSIRPALRLASTSPGSRWDFQWGPAPIARLGSQASRVDFAPDRLSVAWRQTRGTWRPWIRFETAGGHKDAAGTGEIGLQLQTALGEKDTFWDGTMRARASREVRRASTLDTASLQLDLAQWRAYVDASRRMPLSDAVGVGGPAAFLFERLLASGSPPDRRTWQAGAAYVIPVPKDAERAHHCPCPLWSVDQWQIDVDAIEELAAATWTGEVSVAGRTPLGRYGAGVGQRYERENGAFKAYSGSRLTWEYTQGPWRLAATMRYARGQSVFPDESVSVVAEAVRVISPALAVIASVDVTSRWTFPDGIAKRSVRPTVGVDWTPGHGETDGGTFAVWTPHRWAVRVALTVDDKKQPVLTAGLSVPWW